MSISTPFIERPIATTLMMAAILLVGIVAFPLLPVAPLPQVDFPTISVTASLPGAEPADHGVVGGDAAGAAVRADPRRRPDDFDQRPRHVVDHAAVRPRPQHRRGRAGRPGGDQCGGRPIAEEPAEPADLPQGQSGRHADADPVGVVRHVAADHGRRLCRYRRGPADQPHHRRRPGDHRRRAEAVDPGADRPGEARRAGPQPGRSARRHRQRRRPTRRRAASTARTATSPSTPTTR